jgi:hypothetical protein
MSATVRPRRFKTFGTANTGPMPISSGSQPADREAEEAARAASGRAARRASRSSPRTAPAPSLNWLALPAEITPPGIAGLMSLMPS